MKRDGYIIEEIIDKQNLEDSFDEVIRGKLRKEILVEGKWLIKHREKFLQSVREEILSGHISLMPVHRPPTEDEAKNGGYYTKIIKEAGKIRHIQVFCMAARIKVNAVMRVVDRHLQKRYIRTTSASIKNRGMHDLKIYIENDMRLYPDIRFWYKFDIRKFYDTVHQDFAMYALERTFKDKKFLGIMEQFVRMLPDGLGMSMGLRASQGVCNLLLSVYLDHYLKDRYEVKHFYRYCDDGLIGASSKLYLWECRGLVHERIDYIQQEIKPNERIFPIDEGLDFLGYVTYPDEYSRLRKRVKKNYARKLHRIKSRKRRIEIIGSLWGMAKHARCWHLLETLLYPKELNKLKKKRMKDFGKPKSSPMTVNGKKSFRGSKISGRELDHKPFIVVDFESNVIPAIEEKRYKDEVDATLAKGGDTSLVKKPREKYVVSIIFQNQPRKLWTGDRENWEELEARKKDGELPFFCSITSDYSGAFPKYAFCSATAFGHQIPSDEELKALFNNLNIKIDE